MKTRLVACFAFVALIATVTLAQKAEEEPKEIDWKTIKCVVSGKPVNQEAFADYREAKVFFCCQNCPTAFKKETAKYSTKANHQLVATRQFKEEKCPLSGRDLNPEATVKIAEVEVAFCCENCQAKAKEAKGDEQLALVFADKAFEKAFKKVEKEEEKPAE
jgi:hypothetical protein